MKRWAMVIGMATLVALFAAVPVSAQEQVTVQLGQQNNSGESGTAVLTPMGNQTKVTLNLTGAPSGVEQPAHIHPGTCAQLDPKPQYPLNNVVDGQSETTLDVSLETLMSGSFAINVHKSMTEASVYVSCGNIPATGTSATPVQVAPAAGQPRSDNSYGVAGVMIVIAAAVIGGGLILRQRAMR